MASDTILTAARGLFCVLLLGACPADPATTDGDLVGIDADAASEIASGDTADGALDTLVEVGTDVATPDQGATDPGTPDIPVELPVPSCDQGCCEFRAVCSENADCCSGRCLEEAKLCSKTCTSDCNVPGWSCKGVADAGGLVFLCLPDATRLCEACSGDINCEGGICATLDGANVCTEPCGVGDSCPGGFECQDVTSADDPDNTSRQCLPSSGSCDCTPLNAGAERDCQTTNAAGTCTGTQSCELIDKVAGTTEWTPCDAAEPGEELCDGLDNDCDGFADDEPTPPDTPCESTNADGTCPGAWICDGAQGWTCDAVSPTAEVCDLVDNDCDGEVDETFKDATTGIYVADEHCGACGANCVGIFPNATAECQLDPSALAASCVVTACDPGYFQASDTACVPVSDPSCQPCQSDDDCLVPGNRCMTIGEATFCARDCSAGNLYDTPEGECPANYGCYNAGDDLICQPLTLACTCVTSDHDGLTRPCSSQNDDGICTGIETCDSTVGWSSCTAPTPVPETCNGVDDDCNGVFDDDVSPPTTPCELSNGAGTCSGQWVCGGSAGWQCSAPDPAVEACDGQDNDCDGQIDEDFRDPTTQAYVSDDHCGLCGLSCVALFPNATGVCDSSGGAPNCLVDTCDPGFYQVSPTTCLPVQETSCTPCLTDANCVVPGNQCLTIDSKTFCGRDCGPNNLYGPEDECPADFSCVVQGDGTKQCEPDSGSCECQLPSHQDNTRPCTDSNADGACVGFQSCDLATGWSACSARTPAPETCNGEDDECDGQVDDNVVEPVTACEVDNSEGICLGSWICDGVNGWVCDAATPIAEACDGADNNCDGVADEGFIDPASGQYLSYEHCGLCDNSCEGAIPFAVTTDCAIEDSLAVCVAVTCQSGFIKPAGTDRICIPESGATSCSPCTADNQCGALQDGLCETIDGGSYCTASCTQPADCGAGFDCTSNRCRPATGSCSCFDPAHDAAVRLCNNTTAFGVCVGTQTCDITSGWSSCNAQVPTAEECNGLDDDCDNVVDEGVTSSPPDCDVTNAEGMCTGIFVCQGTAGWSCSAEVPAAEICDGFDNNCDGAIDEPFVNAVSGLYVTDADCGVCGNDCSGAIPNATAGCVEGAGAARCEVVTCDPGFYQVGPLTCLPTVDALCTPCVSDINCPTPGDVCLTVDGGGYCGRDCSSGNLHGHAAGECPAGYQCATVSAGVEQCSPVTESCTCLPGGDGDTRGCASSNNEGTCLGTQTCDASGGAGWSPCNAPTPAAETCDSEDNDCNGIIDDVPDRGSNCTNSNGFGDCAGVLDCVSGQGALQCVGPTASAESCNGADDDCDGESDETFTDLLDGCLVGEGACQRQGVRVCNAAGDATECNVSEGPVATEVCDGVDNDCDTSTDEAWTLLGTNCTVGVGACTAPGVYVCDTGDTSGPEVCNAVAGPAGSETCNGLDDDCDNATDEELSPPSCALTQGVCAGSTQSCGGASGFVACTPTVYGADYEQSELSCDGLDNDCDGTVDTDAPDRPCALQQGVCAGAVKLCNPAQGFQSCTGPEYGANYETSEATCDYLDNDCNGAVDEHVKTGSKYTDQDHCGFCGNSCTGAIINGTGTCDGALATPSCVVASCDPGFVQAGATQCLPSTLGLCEPCVNANDCLLPGASCVGLVDGNFCLNPCGASCPTGYTCEDPGVGSDVCVPDTDACICNSSTEGLTKGCTETFSGSGGPYDCFGTETCGASGWSACSLPGESCNLVDDDCDGTVDEGFVDGTGRYINDSDCGTCGNDCTGLNFPGTIGSCDTTADPPACQVECTSNCFDVNANPTDGCECCDPSPEDFPDLGGTDENCDGIDGELTNSIFVSKDGSDSNDGLTIATPKLSIQAGIAAAVSNSKRDVLVATGVYVEQVNLSAGVGLYGGYASGYATRDLAVYESAIVSPPPAGGLSGAVNITGVTTGGAGATRLDGFSVFAYQEKTPGASSYGVFVYNSDGSVAVTNNKVVGGSGGKGARGSDGVNGEHGVTGTDGVDAKDVEEAGGSGWDACVSSDTSPGGSPGVRVCGSGSVDGGSGGLRNCPVFTGGGSGVTDPPDASEVGAPGSGGAAGGSAGWDVFHQAFSCSGYEVFGVIEGTDGADGSGGVDGTTGPGCADSSGTVSSGLWSPNAGQAGGDGTDGGGGGGGGSGAGAHVWSSCGGAVPGGGCATNSKWGNHNIGGSGGGGGSGACAATAGTEGTGGGGAFSLFVAWDLQPATVPEISGNTIQRGFGGPGGDGGNAGVGGNAGAGGLGGSPGSDFDNAGCSYPSFKGGKGGNGGNGGHGGGGGGGCGGPAYGLFSSGQGGADLSTWTSSNTFVASGAGGAGGVGGFSLGNPGGDGATGAAADTNF